VARSLLAFCQDELSSLFFDIRRDSLYCDRPDAPERRAVRTVLDAVFERLTIWLSPLIPFTMEEAWTTRFPGADSNSFRVFPETPADWRLRDLEGKWGAVSAVTSVVTGALEVARREKQIGASLEARAQVYLDGALLKAAFDDLDPAEIFRTSEAGLALEEGPPDAFRLADVQGVAVKVFKLDPAHKCARCWRVLPEVTAPKFLCERCDDAVAAFDASHRETDVPA